jgi:hypothetical protein
LDVIVENTSRIFDSNEEADAHDGVIFDGDNGFTNGLVIFPVGLLTFWNGLKFKFKINRYNDIKGTPLLQQQTCLHPPQRGRVRSCVFFLSHFQQARETRDNKWDLSSLTLNSRGISMVGLTIEVA